MLPTSRQPWSDAYRGAWREALNSVYLKRGCGKPAHLPSSTLAASSWRHLPKARAWTVHLHSYHLRLLLLAAGVIYLKHAHGPCIYLLPGRVSMATVTSASLSRDSTNQGHHHRRGPFNLFRGRVFVPFRESVTGRFCFASSTQTSPLPTLTFVCSVSHTAGATVTLDGAHVPGFLDLPMLRVRNYPPMITWGALCL